MAQTIQDAGIEEENTSLDDTDSLDGGTAVEEIESESGEQEVSTGHQTAKGTSPVSPPAGEEAAISQPDAWMNEIEPEDSSYETVVSATRFDTARGNVPATVTVIDGDDTIRRPCATTDELLRSGAAMQVQRHQGLGNAYPITLNLRGIGSAGRTLVLLDGQPINNALTGSPNFNLLPRDRIQRIEVVRGPFSALYGSRAMSGVIHVITKPGDDDPGVGMTSGLGPYDTYVLAPYAADRYGPFEISVAYERRSTENYLAISKEPNVDYEHHKVHSRIDLYRSRKVSAMMSGGYNTNDMGFNQYVDLRDVPGLGYYLRNEGRSRTDNGYGNLVLKIKPVQRLEINLIGNGFFQMQRFHSVPVVLEGDADFDERAFAVEESTYKSQEWRAEALARLEVTSWLTLVGGFEEYWDLGDWRTENMESGLRVVGMDATAVNQAGYLQSEFYFFDNVLAVIAGGRLDHHSEFGFAFSPKVGVKVGVAENTTLRMSGGKAFRAPSLMELYSPPWQRIPPYLTEGNQDLKPENIYSADLGVEQRFWSWLKGRVTGFFNYGENLIALRLIQEEGVERYLNLQEVYTAGVETELEINPIEQLRVVPNYTYTYSYDADTGEQLDYTPSHLVGVTVIGEVEWSSFDFRAAFDMQFVGPHWYTESRNPDARHSRDPYAVGNLRLEAGFEGLSAFVDFYNLWDMRYEATAGIESGHFTVLAGLRAAAPWPYRKSD
jgi:outer membrane cobalamin receptor